MTMPLFPGPGLALSLVLLASLPDGSKAAMSAPLLYQAHSVLKTLLVSTPPKVLSVGA